MSSSTPTAPHVWTSRWWSAQSETITTSGQSALLDTTSAAKQTVLLREALDGLPVSYDVWSIARLVPGVVQNIIDVGGRNMPDSGTMHVHGSSDREEGYWIDGLDVTSAQENGVQFKIDTFGAAEVTSRLVGRRPTLRAVASR